MNINNWLLYYKTHETERRPTTTQMCYEPRINPEGNVFCMNFCFPCEYQSNQPRLSYTKEHVEYMFQRETKYLEIFKNKPYSPEILDITNNKIFIKWYKYTCNDQLYKLKNLNSNWLENLKEIIVDQYNTGYLKATVYPHSHYYDDSGQLKTIDFYATVEKNNTFLKFDEISSVVGLDTDRFKNAQTNNLINIESIFKSGLLTYGNWPKQLTDIYRILYEQQQYNG